MYFDHFPFEDLISSILLACSQFFINGSDFKCVKAMQDRGLESIEQFFNHIMFYCFLGSIFVARVNTFSTGLISGERGRIQCSSPQSVLKLTWLFCRGHCPHMRTGTVLFRGGGDLVCPIFLYKTKKYPNFQVRKLLKL